MEGGAKNYFYPKKNDTEGAILEIEHYWKELPPPPPGKFWERRGDKTWQLLDVPKNNDEDGDIIFSEPVVINHIVMPSDSLQGLCLRYRAKAVDVRRWNCFSGNNIKAFKSLKIPIEPGPLPKRAIQQETPELLLQIFRNETGESTAEAKVYLSEANGNLEAALRAWREDESFATAHESKSGMKSAVVEGEETK